MKMTSDRPDEYHYYTHKLPGSALDYGLNHSTLVTYSSLDGGAQALHPSIPVLLLFTCKE